MRLIKLLSRVINCLPDSFQRLFIDKICGAFWRLSFIKIDFLTMYMICQGELDKGVGSILLLLNQSLSKRTNDLPKSAEYLNSL
jgi:hypothetical protein